MIEIKVTIEEQPDGSVMVNTKSLSVGTTKEMIHTMFVIKSIELGSKILIEATGGHQVLHKSIHKIVPVGDG